MVVGATGNLFAGFSEGFAVAAKSIAA